MQKKKKHRKKSKTSILKKKQEKELVVLNIYEDLNQASFRLSLEKLNTFYISPNQDKSKSA